MPDEGPDQWGIRDDRRRSGGASFLRWHCLGRLAMDMEPDGVGNLEDFILHLIRTYDYDRTRVTLAA